MSEVYTYKPATKDRQPTSAITLETDEIGIWLMDNTPDDRQRLGLVTWAEIARRVRQKNQQVEYLESLGVLDVD